jgi:hypothetical protein
MLAWYLSTILVNLSELGNYDFSQTANVNGPWWSSIYNTPAFQVDGVVQEPGTVPEPGSVLLVGIALIGIAFQIVATCRSWLRRIAR